MEINQNLDLWNFSLNAFRRKPGRRTTGFFKNWVKCPSTDITGPPTSRSTDTWSLALNHLSAPRPEWLNSRCGRLPLPGLNLTRTISPPRPPPAPRQPPRASDSRGARRCPRQTLGQRRRQVGTSRRPEPRRRREPPAPVRSRSLSSRRRPGRERGGPVSGPAACRRLPSGDRSGGTRRGSLAAREKAAAPWGCGPRAGPLSAGKGGRRGE